MPHAPNASRTAAGVPARWCMRIFKDHDAEGVWSWFAALSSQSMARRSVLSLWHQYRGRTRQLFETPKCAAASWASRTVCTSP